MLTQLLRHKPPPRSEESSSGCELASKIVLEQKSSIVSVGIRAIQAIRDLKEGSEEREEVGRRRGSRNPLIITHSHTESFSLNCCHYHSPILIVSHSQAGLTQFSLCQFHFTVGSSVCPNAAMSHVPSVLQDTVFPPERMQILSGLQQGFLSSLGRWLFSDMILLISSGNSKLLLSDITGVPVNPSASLPPLAALVLLLFARVLLPLYTVEGQCLYKCTLFYSEYSINCFTVYSGSCLQYLLFLHSRVCSLFPLPGHSVTREGGQA